MNQKNFDFALINLLTESIEVIGSQSLGEGGSLAPNGSALEHLFKVSLVCNSNWAAESFLWLIFSFAVL